MRRIEDYYVFIFSFPKVNMLIIYIALTHVIRYCTIMLVNPVDLLRIVMMSVYYDISILGLALLTSALLNFKRALGLTCINDILTTTLFSFMLVLGVLTSRCATVTYLLSSYNISYCLLHLVLRSFADNSKTILILPSLYLIPAILLFSQTLTSYIPIVEMFVSLIVAEATTSLINRSGKSLIGVHGTNIFKAFMKLLLLNENKDIERILMENLSKREIAKVAIVMFKRTSDGRVKAVLVMPRIHPGPFRNVGSSILPSMLVSRLEKYNIKTVVLHRASTHNLDMVSSEEVSALVNEISRVVTCTNQLDMVDVSYPLLRESVNYRCLGQRFGKYLLVIVSRKDQGMEDIPESLEADVNLHFEKEGYEIVVIDAHNSINYEGENIALIRGSEEYNELVKLILEVAEELCHSRGYKVIKAGVYVLKRNFDPLLGLGDCGVSSLTLVVREHKLSLLVFDANNMVLNLRDRLMDELRNERLSVTEILTTDNHTIAGALPRVKYCPLGLKISIDELLKMSKATLIGSLEDLEPVEALVSTVEREVRVLGEESFEKIKAFVLTGVKLVKIVLLTIPLMILTHTLIILLT